MPRKLKVFRTAVGFRDAYVAAPSRAAALRAWGTDKDLFARGAAEEVTDEELGAEALKSPGEVIYRTRGGLEEQVAALGKLPSRKVRSRGEQQADQSVGKSPPIKAEAKPPKPMPSRAPVEAAEQAIAALEREQEAADAKMQERERALAAERSEMARHFAKELEARRRALDKAQADYRQALDRWQP